MLGCTLRQEAYMGIKVRSVPYHRQQKIYWCGPATLQMLVYAVTGVRMPQRRLARMCGTNRMMGTTLPGMRAGAEAAGLCVRDKRNATLGQLARILRRKVPVVVLYHEFMDEDQHVAIVTRLTRRRITLHDPLYGPNFSMPRREFRRRWRVWGRWKWMMWPVSK